ncbi:MAG TPA: DUF6252 family protein [Candidatus Kapabacteria bacterium]|nr:DUF6252 family protein [Candidatus Kapabacteria bacterium]
MRSLTRAALALTVLAIGCVDPSTDASTPVGSVMSATVMDHPVVMRNLTRDRIEDRFFVSGTTAVDPPNENIILSFDSLYGPGRIDINPTSTRVQVRYRHRPNATTNREFKGISGQVTIENFTEAYASGTFSFTAQLIGGTDMITVNEGSFETSLR